MVPEVTECPHCHSKHIVKNGFNPKLCQKYRCKNCLSVFLPTTRTLFQHSKEWFDYWRLFIAGKHKGYTFGKKLTGLSHYKKCLMPTIDDKDNMLFKIAEPDFEDKDELS